MKIFLLLILSHILGDLVFTSSRLARLKRSGSLFHQVAATAAHSAVHTFWAGLFISLIGGPWIKGAFLVLGFHFIIDMIRSGVEVSWFGAGREYPMHGIGHLNLIDKKTKRKIKILRDAGFGCKSLDHKTKGFVSSLGKSAIIDEIQGFPLLTVAVKYAIDNENALFFMTGSSSIGLMDAAADTLAGRT